MSKIKKLVIRLPKYKGSGCTACLKCQEVCPSKAIVVKQEDQARPIFDYNKCSSSFECMVECPENVIHNRKLKHRDLFILLALTFSFLIAAIVIPFV